MTPYEYLNFTDSTASNTYTQPQKDIAHGIIGVSNEAGELLGLLKKMMFNERIITREQIADELGDVAWYMARVLRGIGMGWEELFDINVAKLEKRYSGSYSATKAAIQADKTDPLSPSAWAAGFNGA